MAQKKADLDGVLVGICVGYWVGYEDGAPVVDNGVGMLDGNVVGVCVGNIVYICESIIVTVESLYQWNLSLIYSLWFLYLILSYINVLLINVIVDFVLLCIHNISDSPILSKYELLIVIIHSKIHVKLKYLQIEFVLLLS